MRVSNKTIESNSRQPTCTTITIINNSSLKKQLIRTYTTCIKQTQFTSSTYNMAHNERTTKITIYTITNRHRSHYNSYSITRANRVNAVNQGLPRHKQLEKLGSKHQSYDSSKSESIICTKLFKLHQPNLSAHNLCNNINIQIIFITITVAIKLTQLKSQTNNNCTKIYNQHLKLVRTNILHGDKLLNQSPTKTKA
eukprot:gene2928-1910_t